LSKPYVSYFYRLIPVLGSALSVPLLKEAGESAKQLCIMLVMRLNLNELIKKTFMCKIGVTGYHCSKKQQ
jgi:hypothetical protein